MTVEDPRALEKVILHLVTNLPSPKPENISPLPEKGESPTLPLAIIPPRKERIISAIEKIYKVINIFSKDHGLSPKCQKYYNNINSNYKPDEDEIQDRLDYEPDLLKSIEEKEPSHQQLDIMPENTEHTMPENTEQTIIRKTDLAERVYRFFWSRNREANPSQPPPPVTTQAEVAHVPSPIIVNEQSRMQQSQNDDLVATVPPSNERATSDRVDPIPGTCGIKRQRRETSHQQNKIRKTPSSENEIYSSTEISVNWAIVEAPYEAETVISLVIPVNMDHDPTVQTPHPRRQYETSLSEMYAIPQILQENLNSLWLSQLEGAPESPDQALRDLGVLPEKNSKCYINYCLQPYRQLNCILTNSLHLLQ